MSMPYVVSEAVWSAKAEDETVVLKSDFERCQVVVVEITTAAFSGTIDIQGKVHEISDYSNVPYIRQDQATLQTPSVSQISHTTDTGLVRYVILGYWRRLQIVMTRTAGTITCGVVGSSSALVFPYLPTKLIANSGVDIGDVDITSIVNTVIAGMASLPAGTNNIGDVDVLSTAITKTVETELNAIAAVAADAQDKSSELALTNMKKATIYIDHGRDATGAFVGAGTEYRVEASEKATGNDTWRTIASVEAVITAALGHVMDEEEAAGTTLILIGATSPVVGDIQMFKNATIANSEWGKVVAKVNSESLTLQDGLTNTQAAITTYSQGEHFVLTLDITAFTRLRVICNNNNGTTNRAIVWRCAAVTQV